MIHLVLWEAITHCWIVCCCCTLISCSSSQQFRVVCLSPPKKRKRKKRKNTKTKMIINQLCLGKIWCQVRLSVLTGRHFQATNLVSLWQWQLPAQQQDNYIQVQGFDSTNSRWIFPACSRPPSPPPTTPLPLCRVVSLRASLEQMPLKNLQASHVTEDLDKKLKHFQKTWKSRAMLCIIVIGMAATGNIPLNIPEDNGTC